MRPVTWFEWMCYASIAQYNKYICFLLDFFEDECTADAADACSEFRRRAPATKQFDSTAFTQYCG